MEINKQLFEDVLSGKLKGTFVLRANNRKVNSEELERNNFCYSHTHPYRLLSATYNLNGKTSLYNSEMPNDIIDFIPDTNMKENELTIEIPDGKIVDWEESKKQNKIVLKDKQQMTYEDVCEKLFGKNDFYYICANGTIAEGRVSNVKSRFLPDANNAFTKHQLKCILAKNKLANVALYLNDGWKPSKDDAGYVLNIIAGALMPIKVALGHHDGNVFFKTNELAQQAIEILGEETIKLALEPLGI